MSKQYDYLVMSDNSIQVQGLISHLSESTKQITVTNCHSFEKENVEQCRCVLYVPPPIQSITNNNWQPIDTAVATIQTLLTACEKSACPLIILDTIDSNKKWSGPGLIEQFLQCFQSKTFKSATLRFINLFGSKLSNEIQTSLPGLAQSLAQDDNKPLPMCHINDALKVIHALAEHLCNKQANHSLSCLSVTSQKPLTPNQIIKTFSRTPLNCDLAYTEPSPDSQELGINPPDFLQTEADRKILQQWFNLDGELGTVQQGLEELLHFFDGQPDGRSEPESIPEIRPSIEPNKTLLEEIGYVLHSGRATNNGPKLQAFERSAAEFLQVKDSVAVANGSDALYLALKAVKGDKKQVVLPAYTYRATLNAVLENSLQPVFCDIDPRTFTLCPQHLAQLLKQHHSVAAVIPVNVFGVSPALTEIKQATQLYDTKIVYDNAQGFGASYRNQRAPAEADIQIFSLHATKVLPAVEGGLIVCRDESVLQEVKIARAHGINPQSPLSLHWGVNSKMDEMRALVASHSLSQFDSVLQRRRSYAKQLDDVIQQPDLARLFALQDIPENCQSNFQNFALLAENQSHRDECMNTLRQMGVGCRSYFDPPLHQLDAFQKQWDLPQTDQVWQRLISLPMHSDMSKDELNIIGHALHALAKRVAA